MAKRKVRNPDHVRRRNVPAPSNEAIEARLMKLLTPAVAGQMAYYRQLKMRSRILTLPLMVAAVLTLLWRQVPSVHELTRMLARENLLWCRTVKVKQQSLSERFLVFPAELFERVLKDLLPSLKTHWEKREKRPLPPSVVVAHRHFDNIWVADGSTLEALFRKLKVLQDLPPGQLAGKMCTIVDIVTRLPVEVWFREKAQTHDTSFIPDLLAFVPKETLLLLDRGFYDFKFFTDLLEQGSAFITRPKSNSTIEVIEVLTHTDTVEDLIIMLGSGQKNSPKIKVTFRSPMVSLFHLRA